MGLGERRPRGAAVSVGARVRRAAVFAGLAVLVAVGAVGAAPGASAGSPPPSPPGTEPCAPLDVALIIDSSTSMNPAIGNVKDGAAKLVDRIETVSGGDYRIALVDFADDVQVRVPFGDRNAQQVRDAIPDLYQDRRNYSDPEAWDQALLAAVETRPGTHHHPLEGSPDSGVQIGDFSGPWRDDAEKIIVLVSDAVPGGYSGEETDEARDRAYTAASKAYTAGIRVATVFVPNRNHMDSAAGYLHRTAELGGGPTLRTAEDGSNLADGLDITVSNCAKDSDRDGLWDLWETEGYDADGDGTIDVDLPAMGADPNRADLFVQVNWMHTEGARPCWFVVWCPGAPSSGDSHRPNPDALDWFVEVFANAPVENPDGTTGVTVHLDTGGMAATDAELDGASAKGGPILDHRDVLIPDNDEGRAAIASLRSRLLPDGRDAVFTLVLYAHRLNPVGSDGLLLGQAVGVPGDTVLLAHHLFRGDTFKEAGLLVHEVGHTLGLRHGGYDDEHFKPNYLSIMNYDNFFGGGLIRNGKLRNVDLSRWDARPLDAEAGLDERTGVVIDGAQEEWSTRYRCAGGPRDVPPVTVRVGEPVDWNCDGDTDDTGVTGGVGESTYSLLLEGRNDWATLNFTGGARGALLSEGEELDEEGLTDERWRETERPFGAEVAGPGSVSAPAGSGLVRLPFQVTNTGTEPAELTVEAVASGEFTPPVTVTPGRVELEPGERLQVNVDLDLTGGLDAGETTEVFVSVSGDAGPLGGATAELTVGPSRDAPAAGRLRFDPPEPVLGDRFTVSGSGFDPGESVVITSPDGLIDATDGTADSSGAIEVTLTAVKAGDGRILAVGTGSTHPSPAPTDDTVDDPSDDTDPGDEDDQGEAPHVLEADVTVLEGGAEPPPAEPGGGPPVWVFAAGAALVLLLVLVAVGARRRARRRIDPDADTDSDTDTGPAFPPA